MSVVPGLDEVYAFKKTQGVNIYLCTTSRQPIIKIINKTNESINALGYASFNNLKHIKYIGY